MDISVKNFSVKQNYVVVAIFFKLKFLIALPSDCLFCAAGSLLACKLNAIQRLARNNRHWKRKYEELDNFAMIFVFLFSGIFCHLHFFWIQVFNLFWAQCCLNAWTLILQFFSTKCWRQKLQQILVFNTLAFSTPILKVKEIFECHYFCISLNLRYYF